MLTERQLAHLLEDAERIFDEAAYALLDVLCAQARAALIQGDGMPALFRRAFEIYREQLASPWSRGSVEAATEAARRELAKSLDYDLQYVRRTLETLPERLRAELGQSITNTVRGVSNIVWRDNLAMANAARTNFYSIVGRWSSMVNSGAMRTEDAVRRAVGQMADHGLDMVDYASGVRSQADVAMRRHLRTQLNQANLRTTEQLCLECDVEYVEVDRTPAPRPSHAKWEGRVYKMQGSEPGYPNFYEGTGYQGLRGPYTKLGDRLGGVNCGHTFRPFYPDLDEPPEPSPYSEAEQRERYELTQRQRYYERQVRRWKRRSMLMEGQDIDATKERAKVGAYQKRLRELVKANPGVLARDYNREHVYVPGDGPQPRGLTRH